MILLSRMEIICLIEEIKNPNYSEKEVDNLMEQLRGGVLDPEISNYIFWSDMTSEEIADKVLAYKPIIL